MGRGLGRVWENTTDQVGQDSYSVMLYNFSLMFTLPILV